MSKTNTIDEIAAVVGTALWTLIFVGGIFFLLWISEILQRWLSASIAIAVFIAYVVFAWLTHDDREESFEEYHSSSAQLRRMQANSWLFTAPGWFIVRCLIRLCGGPPPEKK